MKLDTAKKFWIGKTLEDNSGHSYEVTACEDYGGHNQRISIKRNGVTSSVMVPGFESHFLIDYSIQQS